MQKAKCRKCGYLNAQDELVCGMCGEVFKKEKVGLGGKKLVEKVVPVEEKKPAKRAKTEKAAKTKPTRKKTKKRPEAVPETISLPEEPLDEPATEPVPELVTETKPAEEVEIEEQVVEMVEQPAAAPPAAASVEATIRNFLQTEQFRQAVELIAREIEPAKQAGPSGLSPDELKSMVESKIDQALPDFLKSDAVLSVVRQAVSEMPAPEGEVPTSVISEEELEKKIGEVFAKSAGRKGGSSLTIEAVELKINAMLAGIREKVSRIPEDEPPPSLTDVKRIVENHIQLTLGEKSAQGGDGLTEERVTALVEEKLSQVSPATEEIEERVMTQVKQFLEEQGTRELPQAPVDEEKIASLIESKIAEVQLPAAAGTAADTAAIAQEVNSVLEKKFDSTEFALLMMDIVREAVGQTAPAGEESAAGISDEVLALRVGELLPEIIKGEQFHQAISAAIEEFATQPQLTARDVERIANTRFEILRSDLVSSDSFTKNVTQAVEAVASKMAEAPTPEDVETKISESMDSLRAEVEKLVAAKLTEQLDSEELTGRMRTLAAEEAAKAGPEAPAPEPAEIDDKLAQLREEVEKTIAESLEEIQGRISEMPGTIDEKVSAYWQEKLSSEEIVDKISAVARQIAEGTLEARPALTKDDISNAWDDKFDSEETLNKIRDLAGQITMSAMAAQPALEPAEIDDKLAQLREEVEKTIAESLQEMQDRIAEMPGTIDEKVSAHWQEKLSSEEIVDKISAVARQIAEGTLEARPALTKDDISKAWDDKFDSEDTLNKIRDVAGQISMSAIASQPALSPAEIDEKLDKLREEVEKKTADSLDLIEDQVAEIPEVVDRKLETHWQEKLSSEEIASKIRDIAAETAEEEVSKHPSLSPEDIDSKIAQAVQNSTKELLSSEELTRKVEQLAGTISEDTHESKMPKLIENISSLITGSIRRALRDHLDSEEFSQAVGKLADSSAEQALTSQPRLTPEDVREIAGGSFDHWIETYFKSEDFKEKVTEHTRNVAVELLRDARTVILEDAQMRTGEQIQTSISALEYVDPATLSEKIEGLQTSVTDKLSELEEKFAASVEEKVSSRDAEFDSKIEQAASEIDGKLKEVALAFEQDIRPFKEQLEELGEDMNDKLAPLYEQFKELSMQVEKDLPALETEVGEFVKNAAASAATADQRLKSLANQVSTNIGELAKKVEYLYGDFKTAKSELDKVTTQKLAAYDKMIEGMAARVASITPVDSDSIERMITAKVGDLPRQVEVYQKRLAALAEESLSSGPGGGISEAQVAEMIEEKLASADAGALGLNEVAALVVTQLDMYMADLFTSDKFKKAIHENVTVGVEGGIDKEQFEQALRAFVQLEIKRVSDATRELVSGLLESDAFAQKVGSLAPAGAAGEGAAALDSNAILQYVKKALDTKEVNLKIAQKFLEVMTYVKSEVPKLVQAALSK